MKRNSSVELCRLFLIIMIIMHHYIVIGGASTALIETDSNYHIVNTVLAMTIIAVNGFVLISGYYRISFKWKRVLGLYFQILFYSILITFLFYKLGIIYDGCNLITYEGSFKKVIFATVFPIISGPLHRWWYFTIYFGLYFLSPFINKLLDKLDKKDFMKLWLMMILMDILLPSLGYDDFGANNGFSLFHFIVLYITGRGIKEYWNKNITSWIYLSAFVIISIAMAQFGWIMKAGRVMYNSIPCYLSSICFVLFFLKHELNSGVINFIAAAVPGVYLIHDHPYIRHYIYENVFKVPVWYNAPEFVPRIIVHSLLILGTCLLIEICRKEIFGQAMKRWKGKAYVN